MSGSFGPKKYQQTAINKIVNGLETALAALKDAPDEMPVAVRFQAPTGSGKTAMALSAMAALADAEKEHNLAFIWIAPNKLHEAAHEAAKFVSGGALEPIYWLRVGERLEQNQVLFVNWGSINKSGNIARKRNETGRYLSAVIAHTKEIGRRIVLVIDESHFANDGYDNEAANRVKAEIGPAARIEMSATLAGPVSVKVDRGDAVAEGIIRARVLGNPKEDLGDGGTDGEHLFEIALAKREALRDAYRDAGSQVNPLLIIQIPDGADGQARLDEVRHWLDEREMSEGRNGTVITWLANDKPDPDWISGPRDPRLVSPYSEAVDILICKQAVAMGWDCPRAQVLLKMRPASKSETFDIQTVGRVMRSAEPSRGTPYGNPILDNGYVYHQDEEYVAQADGGDGDGFYGQQAVLRDTMAASITTDVAVAPERGLEVEHIAEAISAVLDADHRLDFTARDEITTRADEVWSGEDEDNAEIEFATAYRSPTSTEINFREMTTRWAGDSRSAALLRAELYWQVAHRGLESDIEKIQTACVVGAARIGDLFDRAFADVRARHGISTHRKPVPHEWTPQKDRWYPAVAANEKEAKGKDARSVKGVDHLGTYAYVPMIRSAGRLGPERRVEMWLALNDAVAWWMKNGEVQRADFSITYEFEEDLHDFFPDYVVMWSDGTLGLYEAKSDNAFTGGNEPRKNKAKMEALTAFAASHKKTEGLFALVDDDNWLAFCENLDEPRLGVKDIDKRHPKAD
jgi:type III restriction enzyme